MIAITVDDERPMLTALTRAVSASPDISSVTKFSACTAALEWAQEHRVDIAFLDITMRGMGGLALAEKLVELHPECRIVFCTGYAQYAVDAFRLSDETHHPGGCAAGDRPYQRGEGKGKTAAGAVLRAF